ncbi:hypothetical protein MMC21_005904 [Puttea exsequens]|nr:hypothetical protein [Puttea exsequens]
MPLTFYHVPFSTSNATSAVLAELEHSHGSPLCDRVELSIQAGDAKTGSFLSNVNPNGRVPAIVHDGVPIWESAAIAMYLGEMFGVSGEDDAGSNSEHRAREQLYPALGPQRGEAMKWIVWTNVTIAPTASRLRALLSMLDKDKSNEALKKEQEALRKDGNKSLNVLDGALEGRKYLLGENYCLADTHVWTFVRYLAILKVDLSSVVNVEAWMGRVGARPALKQE